MEVGIRELVCLMTVFGVFATSGSVITLSVFGRRRR